MWRIVNHQFYSGDFKNHSWTCEISRVLRIFKLDTPSSNKNLKYSILENLCINWYQFFSYRNRQLPIFPIKLEISYVIIHGFLIWFWMLRVWLRNQRFQEREKLFWFCMQLQLFSFCAAFFFIQNNNNNSYFFMMKMISVSHGRSMDTFFHSLAQMKIFRAQNPHIA